MTIILYAQPYDISAEGFYFRSSEEYEKLAPTIENQFGDLVEEFELQFIDGGQLDCELAKAWGINQANFSQYFDAAEDWDEEDKIRFILAVDECGYDFDPENTSPDDFDVDIYRVDSMRDLAIEFVDEGLFGEIPERFQCYLDYDAIARDLQVEYSEAIIAGERLIYRCG
ncbi:MAG: antirestriction protein ArdA [Pseudomonadota bacterium]